ncbi:uncharacterized protein LACBIDRAFT_327604 [Laccaria bicolor S238N-H82]|uniref:Predicted protein n=1 Tax=Laccaria bicolor (strain S238N-H82 / ATCC MYA-4686) TaxID=486041 RepID=B0DC86_LACBS|nr:uncharacterized protein LACBIDRAFT_327604 [Laccaria bicolor S238N-H82]EDR07688.1 predicted protein [Laccaria bicolor S238N-H82]|eukprot:XP_001881477.1 predicted protein [Laccaria bicolor S238N-H82]
MAAVGHDVEHAIDVDMEVGLTMGKGKSEGGIDIEMAEVKHEETEVGAIPKADKDVGRVTPTIIIEPPTPHTSAIFKSTETEVGTNTDKGKGQEIGPPASEMEWIVPELAMRPELGLAVNYMQQSFTPPPVERTSRPEGSRLVSRSRQVSPPDPKEVHLDTALYQKKIDFRSLSPPPNFDMQTMQQEIRRLAHGQADLLQKLRDQQAQVSVMESSTPTMREYSAFVVRKQDIDASALLPLAVDSPVTLSQRLLALEEITQCIQDQDLASRPLSEKIASLETSIWFEEEKITRATRRMDRIEESAYMRWKETQEDLQSIRSDHQRLEAEVREAVKTLENKWETTPAALQESLTRGFEKLASRIETAELTLHDLTKSNMWYNAAQWLNHPWILAYTEMARAGPSVDWTKMFSIPQPTTPTFFMEGYAGPSPPLPPSSTDSLLPVTVPTPPLPVPTASSSLLAPTKPTRRAKSTDPVPAAETKSKSKTKSGRRKPEAGSSAQPQSEVTPNDTAAPVQSKKRKGDSIEARPKKTRVVSAEFINSSSDEETLKPKLESLRPVGGEAKAVKPKSQPHFSRMTPSAGFSLIRRPKLDPNASPPKTAMAALRQAKTAERLANQNAAIAKGNYQLADIPCEACSKRQDRDIVPCAIRSPPQQGSCFTCSTGKTTCTYAVTKKKDTDSEVEDEIQKGLQDLETATVSRGDAQVKIVRKKARSKKPQVKKVKPDVTLQSPTLNKLLAL